MEMKMNIMIMVILWWKLSSDESHDSQRSDNRWRFFPLGLYFIKNGSLLGFYPMPTDVEKNLTQFYRYLWKSQLQQPCKFTKIVKFHKKNAQIQNIGIQ